MDSDNNRLDLLNIMGLGEFSSRKSYFSQLEQEKVQHERTFSESLNGIIQVELNGDVIICNPALWKMCNYVDYRDFIVSCKNIGSDLFKDKTEFEHIIDKIRSKKITGFETQLKKSNGEIFFVYLSAHNQFFDGHEIIELFIQNIDERKRAIEDAKIYTTKILDAASQVAIISTDLKGVIVKFNKGAEIMLGYSSKDIEGIYDVGILHLKEEIEIRSKELTELFKEEVKGFEVFVKSAVLNGSDEREWTYVKKTGEHITVNLVVTSINDKRNNVIGYLGVAKDVTKEKKARLELLQAKNMITSMMDSMTSIIIGIDSDYKITHWNKHAELATGVSKEKAYGLELSDVYSPLNKYKADILNSIKIRSNYKKIKILSQDKKKYFNINVTPLLTYDFTGGVIRIDDVTEQVYLEELVVQSDKMLSVGGLAAGMAHEINNPLAGIIQNAQNVERRLFEPIEKNKLAAKELGIEFQTILNYLDIRDVKKNVDGIISSGIRASKIVKNMLSFSRNSTDSFIHISMSSLIDDTLFLVENDYNISINYDFKSIEIKKEFEENLPNVLCDASKIEQVIFNLIKNGIEAMGECDSPQFIIRIYRKHEWIILEIEDNGEGMTEEVRKRVFEPFYTTKEVGRGTGLGMSVSYFIIHDLHHGEISVESFVTKGSKFIIKLPL